MRSLPLTAARTRAINSAYWELVVRGVASAFTLWVTVFRHAGCTAVCNCDAVVYWRAVDPLIAVRDRRCQLSVINRKWCGLPSTRVAVRLRLITRTGVLATSAVITGVAITTAITARAVVLAQRGATAIPCQVTAAVGTINQGVQVCAGTQHGCRGVEALSARWSRGTRVYDAAVRARAISGTLTAAVLTAWEPCSC